MTFFLNFVYLKMTIFKQLGLRNNAINRTREHFKVLRYKNSAGKIGFPDLRNVQLSLGVMNSSKREKNMFLIAGSAFHTR